MQRPPAQPGPGRAARLAWMLFALVLPLGGCFSYRPAGHGSLPPEPLASDAWPAFDTDPLAPLAATPEAVPRFVIDRDRVARSLRGADGARVDETVERLRERTTFRVHTVRPTEYGLLRLWSDPRDDGLATRRPFFSWSGRREEFVRGGAFLTGPALARAEVRERSRREHGLDRGDGGRVGPFGLLPSGEPERWRLMEGIGLAAPVGVRPDAPGLIVHLPSLLENKYEHGVLNRFRRWGWAVAHVETRIGVPGPNEAARVRNRDERARRLRDLMGEENPDTPMTLDEHIARDTLRRAAAEQIAAELPDPGTGFEIHEDTDADALGAAIAAAVDARLAEHAYAAEALVDAVDRTHPHLADRPVVVFGFSGGALAAPAVAARLRAAYPDRPLMLVLVGGGGDILTIARTSTLTDGGITLAPPEGPEPSPAQVAAVQRAYESASRLDPLRVIASLRGVPVLHASADADTVVPTPAARRLDAAHGGADRLVHRGTHNTLFFFINGQAGRMRSWLRSHGAG